MTRLVALTLVCLSLPLFAEDWPGWRGPRGDGTSVEKGIPLDFGPAKNVRWRIDVPGSGYSSPVIVGDRIFLSSCDEKANTRLLLCLDRATGKQRWQREVL